jgi:hypothetical protein
MNSELVAKLASLYETDYQLWISQTVTQLRAHNFDLIDLESLIEELESLGRSDKRAVSIYLTRLCEHLLKVKYWETERERCLRGWLVEIRNFRQQLQVILQDSPSLRNYLQERFLPGYQNGRNLFLDASGLNASQIPEEPDFTLEQALDEDWLPTP